MGRLLVQSALQRVQNVIDSAYEVVDWTDGEVASTKFTKKGAKCKPGGLRCH